MECQDGERYGRFETLQEAKLACLADSRCRKLYDPYCHGLEVYLCNTTSEGKRPSSDVAMQGPCIYLKPGVTGQ